MSNTSFSGGNGWKIKEIETPLLDLASVIFAGRFIKFLVVAIFPENFEGRAALKMNSRI